MRFEELQTFVIYDIKKDNIRNRIGEICKDYGLRRIQYSGFLGPLSRNKRQELCLRLSSELGESPGKILVLPVCEKDTKNLFKIENESKSEETVIVQENALAERTDAAHPGH